MGNNVVHVDFTCRKSKTRKKRNKSESTIFKLVKLINPFNEEKSLFLRSLAFRFFI
ncbi:hypothetical protein M918_20670 [Clostridium sp. BL8]|nr:hypothetical protein M918_20670 [Clostridium sp. BL8]